MWKLSGHKADETAQDVGINVAQPLGLSIGPRPRAHCVAWLHAIAFRSG
jgi:hypothetical protein